MLCLFGLTDFLQDKKMKSQKFSIDNKELNLMPSWIVAKYLGGKMNIQVKKGHIEILVRLKVSTVWWSMN